MSFFGLQGNLALIRVLRKFSARN